MDGTRSATPARRHPRSVSGSSYQGTVVQDLSRSAEPLGAINDTRPRRVAAMVDPAGEVAEIDLKPPSTSAKLSKLGQAPRRRRLLSSARSGLFRRRRRARAPAPPARPRKRRTRHFIWGGTERSAVVVHYRSRRETVDPGSQDRPLTAISRTGPRCGPPYRPHCDRGSAQQVDCPDHPSGLGARGHGAPRP